jgi:hypothetical protein
MEDGMPRLIWPLLICLWSANVIASGKNYIGNFSCEDSPFGLHLPGSYSSLLRIAPVKSNTVIETENWEGYTTSRRDIEFVGLSLRVITFSNDPERYMTALAKVTKNGPWNANTFKLGQPLQDVQRALGRYGAALSSEDSIGNEAGELKLIFDPDANLKSMIYSCYTG